MVPRGKDRSREDGHMVGLETFLLLTAFFFILILSLTLNVSFAFLGNEMEYKYYQ